MIINTQKLNLVAFGLFLCAVLSLCYVCNFYATKVSLGEINSPKPVPSIKFQGQDELEFWENKLKLTSKFITITDKEKNLYSKLRSIKVIHIFWYLKEPMMCHSMSTSHTICWSKSSFLVLKHINRKNQKILTCEQSCRNNNG